jgi:hypothetical protein
VPAPEPKPEQPDCSLYYSHQSQVQSSRNAQTVNKNNEWNMALNSGDTDRAAEIYDELQDMQSEWAADDAWWDQMNPGC